jgi:hypothetical protein
MKKKKSTAVYSSVHTSRDVCHLGRQMSRLSVQTKLDSFSKSALLRSETSATSESSMEELYFPAF